MPVMHAEKSAAPLRSVLGVLLTTIACTTVLARTPERTPAPASLSVTLNQGEVARWPGIAAKSCALGNRKYPAVDSVCYYPFDVEAQPGHHAIAAIDQDGRRHNATAIVEKVEGKPETRIT